MQRATEKITALYCRLSVEDMKDDKNGGKGVHDLILRIRAGAGTGRKDGGQRFQLGIIDRNIFDIVQVYFWGFPPQGSFSVPFSVLCLIIKTAGCGSG